jgi:hypothetical protein
MTDADRGSAPVRVWISYAHDSPRHIDRVRDFSEFLRGNGVDARLDLPDSEVPQDWPQWMIRQQKLATYILVVISPEYRRRSEGSAPPYQGRGVQYESFLIRNEQYGDLRAARRRVLPVLLEGGSENDIPLWLGGVAGTRYEVPALTVRAAEKLLRYLTAQPYETERPVGAVPVLPARRPWVPPAAQAPEAARRALVGRLSDRSSRRNEAILQAEIRQLLTADSLGLSEDDLGVDPGTRIEDQRRIDLRTGLTVIEVRDDLRRPGVLQEAEHDLFHGVESRSRQTGRRWSVLLTDGADWRLYRRVAGALEPVDRLVVDPSKPDAEGLLSWIEALLATNRNLRPTPQEIAAKLGSSSPAYRMDFAELTDLYADHGQRPEVAIKRRLWSKLLTTALGTNFRDEDELFVNHTLLVVMAEIIGHAVVGLAPDADDISAKEIMSGAKFSGSQISGVVEPDFFDWVSEVPGGDGFVKGLARRLTRFVWRDVEHDVLKVLYESIISAEDRHRLGEYYTPDWLAGKIVAECVDDPVGQRVLDASCGSGTFLFHAVRLYLAAAEQSRLSLADAIRGATTHVIGVDVHPVAVTLARVTYLMAIGMERLLDGDRPDFAVPVYLGDSLRWSDESTLLSYPGLSVSTAEDREIFAGPGTSIEDQLLFPDSVVEDGVRFDQLVGEMAERATSRRRRSIPPSLAGVFDRLAVDEDDRPVLTQTFRKMCRLHDENRDHIWAYYVRNLARPLWLAKPTNRVDVLVGNPPWLAYRYMTGTQQSHFKAMSMERALWSGSVAATNQDLAALFVARCVELYLRVGGRFGFVMPWGVLSRRQYDGFRRGVFAVQSEPVKVAFGRPWDLHRVKPSFFPVPAAVAFGRRLHVDQRAVPLDHAPEVWVGKLRGPNLTWTEAAASLTKITGEEHVSGRQSSYREKFFQGATVVPRVLFIVEQDDAPPLGPGSGREPIRSRRSAAEKFPWRGLPSQHGVVERQFIHRLYLGESLLPFRLMSPESALVPWDGKRLLHSGDPRLDSYPGLARWWRSVETAWEQNRSSERLSLVARLDFQHGLSQQFPAPPIRVVYSKSGMYLAAAVLSDSSAVIDHKLYWGAVETLNEARYLTAVLNAPATTLAVRPLQARGEHNPRDFDKYVWGLPIPVFDPAEATHRSLVGLAERAERVATSVELPAVRFEAQRRRVRDALVEDGVAADIDAIVKPMLLR